MMKRISQQYRLWFFSIGFFPIIFLLACSSPEQKPAPASATPVTPEKVVQPVNESRNLPPTMVSVTISPPTPMVKDMLTAQAVGQDPNHDKVTFYYQWYVNGKELSGEVQSNLAPGSFIKGDRITCQVTPFDGLSQGKPMMSPEAVIINSPPKILKMEFIPEHPGKNTGIELRVTAEDHDQDPLTYQYQWFLDGKPLPATNSNKLEGALLKKETYVWANVTVDDGSQQDQLTSMKVPISNSPPIITSTPPKRPSGVSAYTYKVEATDPDGDPITFTASGAEGVSITPDGTLNWQPKQSQAGLNRLKVTAKDKNGATSTQEWEIIVSFDFPKETPLATPPVKNK